MVVVQGFFADNIHCCRARSGMRSKGVVFRHLQLTHFADDSVNCPMDIGAQTQGLATLFLIPTMYASGRVHDPNWTPPHGIVTILGLGKAGC